jgi:AhpD family alkylhydroperoxidase
VAPEPYRLLAKLNEYLGKSSLGPALLQLIFLRVSQINGCSYCVVTHARELRVLGQANDRIDGVAGWREAPFFDARERAALNWAEVLTAVASTHGPDSGYDCIRHSFAEREMVDLTFAIGLINAWNRIAIGFRQSPDPARSEPGSPAAEGQNR